MTSVASVLAVLLAIFFLCLGTANILAVPPARDLAAQVGLSIMANRAIGVLQVAGAAGLLIGLAAPLLGSLAGVGFLLLLVGAVIAHRRQGHEPRKFAPAVISGTVVVTYLIVHVGAVR